MSSKRKGGGQEGALVKMIERQRMQQAADDAAKLEDAISTGPSGSPPAPGISGGGSPGETAKIAGLVHVHQGFKKNRVPEGTEGKHIPVYTHSSESALFSLSAATSSSTSRTAASLSTSSSTSQAKYSGEIGNDAREIFGQMCEI